MKTIKKIALNFGVIGLFLFTACTADQGPIDTGGTIGNVSFATDIQPIFNNRCTVCHGPTNSTGTGLDLTTGQSYNLLVNVQTTGYPSPSVRVAPFSLDNSVLWHKITDSGMFGGLMPQGGPALSSFEIQQIEEWIEAGAQNN